MDRACVLGFITFVSLVAQGDHTRDCENCKQVCAYSNGGYLNACFDMELRCKSKTHIEILNAVCGARKYDFSCVRSMYPSTNCHAQTSCCQRQTGAQLRWHMAYKHKNRLDQDCSGKRQCRFRAPVDKLINYNMHYCYVLYRCTTDLRPSTTELSSVSITATKKNQRPITTYTHSINPGVHGTKQSHISTRANMANSEVVDSSDLSLPVVIVPVVLPIVGIAAGAVLWKWKRRQNKRREPASKDQSNQHAVHRASNQYETMSLEDSRTSASAAKCLSPTENGGNYHHFPTIPAKPFATTNSNHPSHTEGRVRDNDYNEIYFQQTETASKGGEPKTSLSNANEDKVEANDTEPPEYFILEVEDTYNEDKVEANDNEPPEYFILEVEDTYNEINPTNVEEYNEQATLDSEYNRIRFSERACTVDPIYDTLEGGRAVSTGGYSALSDNAVHATVMTDYCHITAQRSVSDEHDDQYSHLNCLENKRPNVEIDINDDYSHLNGC